MSVKIISSIYIQLLNNIIREQFLDDILFQIY
jgi:hypothetical protein